jgi:hypothetical protein
MLKQLYFLFALFLSAPVMAGGPLILEGPNGHVPAKYQNPAIVFNIESGDLGNRDKTAADLLVNEALNIWNAISTSTVTITQGDDVPVDINETNFNSYIPDPFNSAIHNDTDGLNPIVYDNDGSIIDAFFGIGQGTGTDATVVGFAASSIIISSSFFTEGFAVINGNVDLPINSDQLKLIIAHEIGHYLGLDHSQANINNTEAFTDRCPAADDNDYPLMYPYACRPSQFTHPDDNIALSTLYPAAGFYLSQGQLTGTFVTADGTPVKGANLWVENTQTGEVVSIVSDYLAQCTGFFALMLPEGSYTLHASSINIEFYGGSSVGPYANCPTDFSFQSPASDIGTELVFNADGALPAIINLTAGKSAAVVFKSDSSGSITMSDTQIDLTEIYNSANACSASNACGTSTGSSSGGGSPSLPILAALLCIPVFRASARK